jgi:hypothetical protein
MDTGGDAEWARITSPLKLHCGGRLNSGGIQQPEG